MTVMRVCSPGGGIHSSTGCSIGKTVRLPPSIGETVFRGERRCRSQAARAVFFYVAGLGGQPGLDS